MQKLHHWTLSEMVYYVLFLLLLPHCCEGVPQVIGSSQPIVANVGDDVILPCHLKPSEDAALHTVEWARPDLKPRFVHVWHSGEELLENQNPSYIGRTSLFISELKNGNVSLKLSRVKLSDRGTYRCFIPTINRDITVELLVGSVSSPGINVWLDCRSEGWFPQPELLWLDGKGRVLSAGPTETLRGPDGLFTVSSRLSVEKSNRDSFTCRVHQENITQTRETHIQISADFFETCSPSSVVYISIIVVLSLIVAAAAFIFWKRRKIQTKVIKHQQTEAERKEREQLMDNIKDLEEDKRRLEEEMKNEKSRIEREAQTSLGEKKRLEEEVQKGLDEKRRLEGEVQKKDNELKVFEQLFYKLQEHSREVQKLTDKLKHLKDDTEKSIKKTEDYFKLAESCRIQGYTEMKTAAETAKNHLQKRKKEDEELYNKTRLLKNTTDGLLEMIKNRKGAAEQRGRNQ